MPNDNPPSDKFAPYPCALCHRENRCRAWVAHVGWPASGGTIPDPWFKIELILCIDCHFRMLSNFSSPIKGTETNDRENPNPEGNS